MSISEDVLFEVRDRVAYVTINRPRRRNAIDRAAQAEITRLMVRANDDPEVWAVVMTGAGDKAFCAGGDLKDMDDRARGGERFHFSSPMAAVERNVYEAVLETYKPTIAALNGPAVAGGCELALACDLRIAAEHAYIAMPEARRGMGANFASVLLPRLLPRAVALHMLYTGDSLQPADALRLGLYNAVVPGPELEQATETLVRRIVANAPLTLRRYKHMATKGWELPVAAALRLDAGPNPYLSKDREEGVRAFVEKRAPQWRGE